jgi:hypothetical protein
MAKKIFVMMAVVLAVIGVAGTSPASAAVDVFSVQLAPSGDADGSGRATVLVDSDSGTVCYTIVVRNIDAPTEPAPGLGSAHIHVLPAGTIAVDLDTVFRAAGTDTFVSTGCVDADAATIAALLADPQLYYVNVHTVAFPGGAVQGSLAG